MFGEYNYADFGRKDISFTNGPGTVGSPSVVSTRLNIQTALFGVIGVVALLLVLRPMVLRITSVVPGALAGPGGSLATISADGTTHRLTPSCRRV